MNKSKSDYFKTENSLFNCKSCENIDSVLKSNKTSSFEDEVKIKHHNHEHDHSNHGDHNHNEHKGHDHSEHSGHDHSDHKHKHEAHEHDHGDLNKSKWKLIVGWILLIPLMWTILGPLGAPGAVPDLFENAWWQFSLTTVIVILIGTEFLKETIHDAKRKKLSVDILVTISSTFAYVFSIIFMLIGLIKFNNVNHYNLFFEATSEILVIIFTGRFLEKWITSKAVNEIEIFKNLLPNVATLVKEDDRFIDVDANELKEGDIVLVRKGQKIPSDGLIVQGSSLILESSFTGEVSNFEKSIGDKVIGGTVSTTGEIRVRILKGISDSIVNQILNGIQNTKTYNARTQSIADKVATYLIPVVFTLAILSLVLWGSIGGDWFMATQVMIAVMVIACPCSLGLTTPTSILVGSSVASRVGIFFNSKDVFENFKQANVIVMDKTGTITKGQIQLQNNTIPENFHPLIKKVETNFVHPIAKSIVDQLKNVDDSKIEFNDFSYEEVQSLGISITYRNQEYYLGSEKFYRQIHGEEITLDESIIQDQTKGNVVILFFDEKHLIGFLSFGDEIKESSYEAITRFKNEGMEVYMVTGDNRLTSLHVASQVGIDPQNVYAEVLPQDKQTIVNEFQEQGKIVIFVGDGNNDAPAMKQANLSVSMNSGSEMAVKLSDVTILDNDLTRISDVSYLSNKVLFNIYRGFGISIGYNVIAIPLAMTGLINPFLAAILMMFSDIIALINASTLRLILYKKGFKVNKKQTKKLKKENKQAEQVLVG